MKRPFISIDPRPHPYDESQEKMRSHWYETPRTRWQLRIALPLLRWRFSPDEQTVYLSFDDGPTPGVTDRILDILQLFQAKATFFCLGTSVEKAPETLDRIIQLGHSIGNHTYSHPSGWKSSLRGYLEDIQRCDQVLPSRVDGQPRIFRPPFGELGVLQGLMVLRHRSIVMWDVNSMDYRRDQSSTMIARRVCRYTRPGSIILMHDSEDAGPRTIDALPRILEELSEQGFQFKAI